MGKHRRIDDAETDITALEVPLDEAHSGPMSLRSHGFKPMFRGFEVSEKMPLAAECDPRLLPRDDGDSP